MSCRSEILYVIRTKGWKEFSPQDVVDEMRRMKSGYQDQTVRAHVCSVMCSNAPSTQAIRYDDLVRLGHGRYRIK